MGECREMAADKPVVDVQDVVKDYDNGKVHALRGVTLQIPPGAFFALAGPSGSGKTTLLNLIGGLDVPDGGTIMVDGHQVETLDEKKRTRLRRERIGFIFQDFNLIPVLTARENVELPLEILPGMTKVSRREAALDILAQVGLEGLEDRFPPQLSGGQMQRVAVARALVKRPAIVLADEPTANLDGETGASIVDLMKSMRDVSGTAFIFSTHDPRLMERADTLVHLVDGVIER
ncbi:MAG TPA: ABC transporter ATP-binding protein [Bacteroidetes bacterium]|nr:ABC transporter ATP-binding protein [Bacteroidota bacterium]